jgi:hypothetical protein
LAAVPSVLAWPMPQRQPSSSTTAFAFSGQISLAWLSEAVKAETLSVSSLSSAVITSRWAWTALLGLLLVGLIWVGVFTILGTAYRLQHPQDVGPLIGTLMQLAGLVLVLIAGIAVIVVRFLHPNRSRSIPQG